MVKSGISKVTQKLGPILNLKLGNHLENPGISHGVACAPMTTRVAMTAISWGPGRRARKVLKASLSESRAPGLVATHSFFDFFSAEAAVCIGMSGASADKLRPPSAFPLVMRPNSWAGVHQGV